MVERRVNDISKLAVMLAGVLGSLGGACSGVNAAGAGGAAVTAGGSPGGGSAGAPVEAGGAGSGNTAGMGCTAAPVPLDQVPAQLAAVLCAGVAPCCSAANVPYDAASCETVATGQASQLLPQSSSPNHRYDPAGGGCCLSAIAQELAICQSFDAVVELACRAVTVGTLPAGSACTGSECAPPGYCKLDPNNLGMGTCSHDGGSNLPHGKAGDACISSCTLNNGETLCAPGPVVPNGSSCYQMDGLYCSADRQACVRFGQLGDACSFGTCAVGEFCTSGAVCAVQTDSGPCTDGGSDACTANAYCDGSVCRSPKKPAGAACLVTAECASNDCTGDGANLGICTRETAASGHRCEGGLK